MGAFGLLALLTSASIAQGEYNSSYTGAPAPFSLPQLEKILNSKNAPKTIEQTLDRIGEEAPRIYENFVLMYRSKSLQESSFMHPRAIVYNTDASFLMTFNGHSSQRGFKQLEMIQFKPVENKWELRELREENGKLTLSDPNPRQCLHCHQSAQRVEADPRPNWEPYSRWPGAYGSEGVHFNGYMGKEIYRKEDATHIADATNERLQLSAFLTWVQPGHPRFGRLKIPDVDRLMDKAGDLTDMLARLNFKRVMRLARSDAPEHFSKVQNLLAGAVICGKFFADEKVVNEFEVKTPSSREEFVVEPGYLMRSRRRVAEEFYSIEGEAPVKFVMEPEKFPNVTVSEAIYLLFESFGSDISDWSMDFRTSGRLAFRERFGTPSDPRPQAAAAFRENYPEYRTRSCEDIAPLAVAEAASLKELPVKTKAFTKPLIKACINCHSGDEFGVPKIPFDNVELLKVALKSKATTSDRILLEEIRHRTSDHATNEERMPMGPIKPSIRERSALIEYLDSL